MLQFCQRMDKSSAQQLDTYFRIIKNVTIKKNTLIILFSVLLNFKF